MRLKSRFATAALAVVVCCTVVAAQESSQANRPDNGVTAPKLVREVKPSYTDAAKKKKIEGVVGMTAVVLPDGTVGDVNVDQSLDTTYGLDNEAVKATKRWIFEPGKKDGKPVPVLVKVEMSFTLK